jgi:GH25 family lysozyme M1 (1,4-beta-N-acetylmuramidase)
VTDILQPLPPGARPLSQSEVTPAITAWALECLHDASLVLSAIAGPHAFGALTVVARVEVHTNGTATNPAPHPHRGISVYAVTGDVQAAPTPPVAVLGVDVSSYQPHVIWGDVVRAGYVFAFAKATEGMTNSNALYASQIIGAKCVGLLCGAYHFYRTTSDPVAQARRFVEVATSLELALDLPLALDIEDQRPATAEHPADPLGGLSPADFCEHVHACLDEIAQVSGRKPLAYVEPSTWALLPPGQAEETAALADLWVASYNPTPHIPHGWTSWDFWQYTAKGTVPGISGGEDVSRWRGTADELRAFCGLSDAPTADRCPDTDPSPPEAA